MSNKGKHKFTTEEVKQFRFIFEFNDHDKDRLIKAEKLGEVLAMIGIELSEKELDNKIGEF